MRDNCWIDKTESTVVKRFKNNPLGNHRFHSELSAYLRANKKKLDYIPKLIDWDPEKLSITMERIEAVRKSRRGREPEIRELAKRFLSDTSLHHNDIRFKNVLVDKNNKLYLIDFELSSKNDTDKNDDKILVNQNV